MDFTADDGIRHELWVVSDKRTIAEIADAFAAVPRLYIADGHHRSEAAAVVRRRMREQAPAESGDGPYDSFLTVVFADDELRILPYNRVVRDLNGLTLDELLEAAGAS